MNLKERIKRLQAAVEVLRQRQAIHQARIEVGLALPMVKIGGQSFYPPPQDEWLRMGDILLGVGGTVAWVTAQMVGYGLDPAHDAAVAAELVGLGFEQDPTNPKAWSMPSAEAEINFITDWLAMADAAGREVSDRAAIERWLKRR